MLMRMWDTLYVSVHMFRSVVLRRGRNRLTHSAWNSSLFMNLASIQAGPPIRSQSRPTRETFIAANLLMKLFCGKAHETFGRKSVYETFCSKYGHKHVLAAHLFMRLISLEIGSGNSSRCRPAHKFVLIRCCPRVLFRCENDSSADSTTDD
jgi:hypothetical protein